LHNTDTIWEARELDKGCIRVFWPTLPARIRAGGIPRQRPRGRGLHWSSARACPTTTVGPRGRGLGAKLKLANVPLDEVRFAWQKICAMLLLVSNSWQL